MLQHAYLLRRHVGVASQRLSEQRTREQPLLPYGRVCGRCDIVLVARGQLLEAVMQLLLRALRGSSVGG